MKTKLLLAAFVILSFCFLKIDSVLATTENDFYGGVIYYEQDGKIMENILAAGLKEEIGEGKLPALSKNGKWLVYYNNDNYPVLYNTETEEKTVFEELQCEPVSQPVWSPGNKYFTIESHTSTSNSEAILNKQGEIITSFMTVDDFYWWNKNIIIYTSLHDVDQPRPRGDGGGSGFGISKLNVKKVKTTILRSPSELVEYRLEALKNAKLIYTKYEVADYEGWRELTDQTLTYWKMNKNGFHTLNLEALPKTGAELIADTVGDQFGEDTITDFGKYHKSHWRLFTVRDEETSDVVIYVVHINDASSLFKVDDGDDPTW